MASGGRQPVDPSGNSPITAIDATPNKMRLGINKDREVYSDSKDSESMIADIKHKINCQVDKYNINQRNVLIAEVLVPPPTDFLSYSPPCSEDSSGVWVAYIDRQINRLVDEYMTSRFGSDLLSAAGTSNNALPGAKALLNDLNKEHSNDAALRLEAAWKTCESGTAGLTADSLCSTTLDESSADEGMDDLSQSLLSPSPPKDVKRKLV